MESRAVLRVDRARQVGELASRHRARIPLRDVAVAQRAPRPARTPREVRVREVLAVAAGAVQQRAELLEGLKVAPVERLGGASGGQCLLLARTRRGADRAVS